MSIFVSLTFPNRFSKFLLNQCYELMMPRLLMLPCLTHNHDIYIREMVGGIILFGFFLFVCFCFVLFCFVLRGRGSIWKCRAIMFDWIVACSQIQGQGKDQRKIWYGSWAFLANSLTNIEFWAWTGNFIPIKTINVTTHPCLNPKAILIKTWLSDENRVM